MKFLQVFCEHRKTLVFINIEKIVLLSKADEHEEERVFSLIEVDGLGDNKGAVKVAMAAEDLVRMINGEDKVRIGFKTGG